MVLTIPGAENTVYTSELEQVDNPSASIGTPTLTQGGSAQVTATFNAAAGGQRIDIDHPAGTKITAVANSAFTLNSQGMTGTLPSGTTSVTFTLTADQNAPIGSALGGQITYGANRTKLADFTATIEAPPVAPAVTIESVTVQQGQSVGVDVEFNESVSGQVDIVLPAGLAPTGKAPSGFTWTPSINGFRGTVTDANRAFTMDLAAANDAAVGTFTGAVRGSGLEQAWSATITAAPVAPDVTIESVTVQQGESVDVDVEFNGSVSGEVEIIVPNGLAPVGKAPTGFTWDASGNEFIGTVTNANRAFTLHLAAGANAPVGTFRGEVLSEDLYKRWNVTITAAPVAPDVTIDSVAVQQGDAVDVDVAFNGSVSGEVEIVVPDGLSPDGKAPAGFRWVEADHEFIGTVTDANRAFTMHLAAADDAPVGTFRGYVYGESLYKRWSATITAAPVAPAVTIESVTVQQGESVGVDVAFNASAFGLTDIIVPAGLTPAGKAPAGFTWMPGINGFRGTVTDANRVFTMDLVAATDAAVGTFDGVVRGSQLEQPWSATITAAPVAPAVTIESVTVQQGESVGVDVTFNESVSGQVEILVPAGLTSTGKAPAGFTWLPSINGFSGLVSDANRAFTMDLTAAADAAVGTFDGVVRGGGLNQPWSATITAAPVAPSVTIESVTVQQGESVGVDVTFNESVFGQVDIVLPAGLAPTGKAPAGFTWMPGINGFRGTVTDANRAFTMDLTAAADAAVGTFDGVVRGGGVNEAWSATITAAPVPPAVDIESVTVQQGETVDVDVRFNAMVSDVVDIILPAGLTPAANAPAGFVWNQSMNGFRGTVTNANRAFTMDLIAAPDAAVGTFNGVVRGAMLNQVWSATITAAPVAPAVTIESVSVRQGESVDVPVAFNAGVSGQVEIIVPAGLSPAGNAPAGFTWLPSINGFAGTVTDANRAFTLRLTAAADAAVGTFDGAVRGSGLDQAWSATITAGAPIADEPVVLTSPAIGAVLEPGAPVFSGTGQQGAKIEVYGSWQTLLGRTEVLPDGTWSLTWNKALTPGHYSGGTVRQIVGDKPFTSVPYDFTVESTEVAPLIVTSPKVGDTIEETTPVFTGTAQPGAKVEIRGASGSLLGSVDSVASNGKWSITWNKTVVPGRYSGGTVKQLVKGVERGKFVYDFTIGNANVAPLLVTSPKVGDTTHETTPVFTGTAQPGAKVEIRGAWGDVLGTVDSVASTGRWTITWNKSLLPGHYSGGTVKQFVNGVERGKFVYDFTIVASQLVVNSPQLGETITGTRPVFTGTAIPKAEIQIRGAWGTDLGHTTANEHGEWTITWPTDYKPARYSGGTVTESVNGKVIGSFTYDFTLAK